MNQAAHRPRRGKNAHFMADHDFTGPNQFTFVQFDLYQLFFSRDQVF